MRLRKTWLQYGIGILYLFSVSVLIFTALLLKGETVGIRNRYVSIGLVCAVLLLCLAAAAGGRRLLAALAAKRTLSRRALLAGEVFLVLCLFLGAILLRLSLLRENGGQLTGGQEYLGSGLLPYSSNNGIGLYAVLLGKAAMLTGFPQMTVIFLQAALQLAGMAFFYAGLRCICGRTAALAALAVPAFAPAFTADCFRAGPRSFLFLTVSAGLFASGLFLRGLRRGRPGGVLAAGAAALGLLLGALLFLDRAGLFLLSVPAAGLLCVPKGIRAGGRQRFGLLCLLLLWTGISLTGCFYLKAWLQSGSLQTAFMEWQRLWTVTAGVGVRQLLPAAQNDLILLVPMAGAFVYGIGNWLTAEDLWTPCTFFWAGILLLYGMESIMEGNPYELLYFAVWAAAGGAGAGLLTQPLEDAAVLREQAADEEEDGVRFLPLEEVESASGRKEVKALKNSKKIKKELQRKKPGAPKTKVRANAGRPENITASAEKKRKETEMPERLTESKETAETPERLTESKETAETPERLTESKETAETPVSLPEKEQPEDSGPQEPRTVKFIPNPLPVPKKHVKREMDYAFVPEEEAMKYDLDNLTENDDFDLN